MQALDTARYRSLLRRARRLARSEDEARDLVQDVLLVALDRGLTDLGAPEHQPWLFGVMRKRAAFVARTACRRRNREQEATPSGAPLAVWRFAPRFLQSLPPSLRAVATLASADLSGPEIRWLLQLSPTALRTRLSALRRAVKENNAVPEDSTIPGGAEQSSAEYSSAVLESEDGTRLAPPADPFLGRRRGALLGTLRNAPGQILGTHDPDGHAILFRVAPHKSGPVGN
jgi:DNA-directed RNA polymerase specialized sigma24 family protein